MFSSSLFPDWCTRSSMVWRGQFSLASAVPAPRSAASSSVLPASSGRAGHALAVGLSRRQRYVIRCPQCPMTFDVVMDSHTFGRNDAQALCLDLFRHCFQKRSHTCMTIGDACDAPIQVWDMDWSHQHESITMHALPTPLLMLTDIQRPGPEPASSLCVEARLKNLEDTVAMLKRDVRAVASLRRVRTRTSSSSASRKPKRKHRKRTRTSA